MQVVMKAIGEIQPYSKNAKKHDARQIKNVAESIKQYGFVQPIVVDSDGVIVIGHCRALAAKKLGIKDVPCVCVDDLTKGGDAVLDLFAGSGTTVIACEQNGRDAYAMEFDPRYCDVIVKRWETLTGNRAVLLNDN